MVCLRCSARPIGGRAKAVNPTPFQPTCAAPGPNVTLNERPEKGVHTTSVSEVDFPKDTRAHHRSGALKGVCGCHQESCTQLNSVSHAMFAIDKSPASWSCRLIRRSAITKRISRFWTSLGRTNVPGSAPNATAHGWLPTAVRRADLLHQHAAAPYVLRPGPRNRFRRS